VIFHREFCEAVLIFTNPPLVAFSRVFAVKIIIF